MSFIKPSAQKFDPNKQLTVPGTYYAKCVDVRQGIPSTRFPNKTLVAIEFEIDDANHPRQKGMMVSTMMPESVYRDRQTGKESIFLAFARMMGEAAPERGVDPEAWIGRHYMVRADLIEGTVRVRTAMPAAGPNPRDRGKPLDEIPEGIALDDTHPDGTPF